MQRFRSLAARASVAVALVGLLTSVSHSALAAGPFGRGGFQRDDGSVSDQRYDAGAPSLVLGSLAGDATKLVQWVGFEQGSNAGPDAQDILVKTFNAATNQWVLRGDSLNFDRTVEAEHPSLDFAGPLVNGQRTVPWAAWYEPVKAFGGKTNILASRFVSTPAERWQVAGQDRGSGVPSLNINTNQDAENPSLVGGATQAGAPATIPWVSWEEDSAANGKRQIFVSRAALDTSAIGNFRWIPTGAPTSAPNEPSINVDVNRDGVEPDMIFSGPNNTVPWVVWYEKGNNRPERVFAARAIADSSAGVLGGFRWQIEPGCNGDEVNCALNRNPNRDAEDAKIASGTLPGEDVTKPKPWIVFQENDGNYNQIYVSKFDGTKFVPVGGSLNLLPNQNAEAADIVFVGNVPFVSFVQHVGPLRLLVVRHLANPSTGRWDLTSSPRGLNVVPRNPADAPSLGSNGSIPFVAWQEGDREQGQGVVFEAHRLPTSRAWGVVSPNVLAPAANETQSVTITCNHVGGWANIKTIEFALTTASGEQSLLVRFSTPDDPNQPLSESTLALFDPASNQFLPPVKLGSGDQENALARLLTSQSSASSNGPDSGTVDLTLRFQMKSGISQLLVSNLRVIARDGADSGFVQMEGPQQVFLPVVTR
ncbi:MAG: hypothetical protein MUD01_02515 [Chloroflexaceae bacterium]|jgi:hypothetical protein|nr:hypothetical protein [Chloroflexaceae bacterium]